MEAALAPSRPQRQITGFWGVEGSCCCHCRTSRGPLQLSLAGGAAAAVHLRQRGALLQAAYEGGRWELFAHLSSLTLVITGACSAAAPTGSSSAPTRELRAEDMSESSTAQLRLQVCVCEQCVTATARSALEPPHSRRTSGYAGAAAAAVEHLRAAPTTPPTSSSTASSALCRRLQHWRAGRMPLFSQSPASPTLQPRRSICRPRPTP